MAKRAPGPDFVLDRGQRTFQGPKSNPIRDIGAHSPERKSASGPAEPHDAMTSAGVPGGKLGQERPTTSAATGCSDRIASLASHSAQSERTHSQPEWAEGLQTSILRSRQASATPSSSPTGHPHAASAHPQAWSPPTWTQNPAERMATVAQCNTITTYYHNTTYSMHRTRNPRPPFLTCSTFLGSQRTTRRLRPTDHPFIRSSTSRSRRTAPLDRPSNHARLTRTTVHPEWCSTALTPGGRLD